MKWKKIIIDSLIEQLKQKREFSFLVNNLENSSCEKSIHLAIFNYYFITQLIQNKKKLESRFSINRISPFDDVNKGDIVLVKENGGPVLGYFIVGDVQHFSGLNKKKIGEIKKRFSKKLCVDINDSFWDKKINSKYCCIMEINKFVRMEQFAIPKKNRISWCKLK